MDKQLFSFLKYEVLAIARLACVIYVTANTRYLECSRSVFGSFVFKNCAIVCCFSGRFRRHKVPFKEEPWCFGLTQPFAPGRGVVVKTLARPGPLCGDNVKHISSFLLLYFLLKTIQPGNDTPLLLGCYHLI